MTLTDKFAHFYAAETSSFMVYWYFMSLKNSAFFPGFTFYGIVMMSISTTQNTMTNE
jgi:hypothetical protein